MRNFIVLLAFCFTTSEISGQFFFEPSIGIDASTISVNPDNEVFFLRTRFENNGNFGNIGFFFDGRVGYNCSPRLSVFSGIEIGQKKITQISGPNDIGLTVSNEYSMYHFSLSPSLRYRVVPKSWVSLGACFRSFGTGLGTTISQYFSGSTEDGNDIRETALSFGAGIDIGRFNVGFSYLESIRTRMIGIESGKESWNPTNSLRIQIGYYLMDYDRL